MNSIGIRAVYKLILSSSSGGNNSVHLFQFFHTKISKLALKVIIYHINWLSEGLIVPVK